MSIYEDLLTLPGVDRRAAIGWIIEAVEVQCQGHRTKEDAAMVASMLTAVAILGAGEDPRELRAEGVIRAYILNDLHVDPTNGG